MNFLFHYLSWHYGRALNKIFRFWFVFMVFLYHYFSIGLLLRTLFFPWHRQALRVPDIFPLGPFLEAITFNLISSLMGAIIRTLTILIGLTSIIFVFIFGALLPVTWAFLPIITIPIYLYSQKPTFMEQVKLSAHTMKQASLKLFSSPQGDFILKRLHLDRYSLLSYLKKAHDAALPDYFNNLTQPSQAFKVVSHQWLPLREYFKKLNITADDIEEVASWYQRQQNSQKKARQIWNEEKLLRTPGIGHNWSYGYTLHLEPYLIPISSKYNPLGTLEGYQEEIEEMESALAKLIQNSLLIVGEPGSGRHALVEKLADMINQGYTIPSLRYKRVMRLSLDQLISEAKQTKDVAAKIEQYLAEAEAAGNLILVINQLDRYVCPESTPNLSGVLSSFLENGKLQIIGITAPQEYHRCIELKFHLRKVFTVIKVSPPTKEEMLTIIQNIIPAFELRYNVYFSHQAIKEVIEASDSLYPTTPFPEKAVDALNIIASHYQHSKRRWVLKEDVDRILSQQTHIPYGKIKKEEKKKLLNLENLLHQRIINQEEAIRSIAAALRRGRLKLKRTNRPIGSFLFLGPTGVGKTETAKALAAVYFASEKNLIRLDMSQYNTSQSINRLIGTATGEPSQLGSLISERPFSVLLLDEFEKAATEIHNLFLTIFDEGYLMDASGKKIVFENILIIATSNAGAEFIREKIDQGVNMETIKQELIENILTKEIFSPELINRFDGIVVYKPLTPKELKEIARLQLEKLNKKLYKEHEIQIKITPELIETVAIMGYDPEFGARPMQRVIAEKVENAIAQKLLKGELKKGQTFKLTIR